MKFDEEQWDEFIKEVDKNDDGNVIPLINLNRSTFMSSGEWFQLSSTKGKWTCKDHQLRYLNEIHFNFLNFDIISRIMLKLKYNILI